ncbi:hypothetical protein WA158_002362 [Blastocystis sp. Blastoise]
MNGDTNETSRLTSQLIKAELIKNIKQILPRKIIFVKAKTEDGAHAPYSKGDDVHVPNSSTLMNPLDIHSLETDVDSKVRIQDQVTMKRYVAPVGEEKEKLSKLSRSWLNSKEKSINIDEIDELFKREQTAKNNLFSLKRKSKLELLEDKRRMEKDNEIDNEIDNDIDNDLIDDNNEKDHNHKEDTNDEKDNNHKNIRKQSLQEERIRYTSNDNKLISKPITINSKYQVKNIVKDKNNKKQNSNRNKQDNNKPKVDMNSLFDGWGDQSNDYEKEAEKRLKTDLDAWKKDRELDEWNQLLDQGREKKVKKPKFEHKGKKQNKFETIQRQKINKQMQKFNNKEKQ